MPLPCLRQGRRSGRHPCPRRFFRDVVELNGEQRNFRVFGPDETLFQWPRDPSSKVTRANGKRLSGRDSGNSAARRYQSPPHLSRKECPGHGVVRRTAALAKARNGIGTKSGNLPIHEGECRRCMGVGNPCADSPRGASFGHSGFKAPSPSKSISLGGAYEGRSQSSSKPEVLGVGGRVRQRHPGGDARCPRSAGRRPIFGPVSLSAN